MDDPERISRMKASEGINFYFKSVLPGGRDCTFHLELASFGLACAVDAIQQIDSTTTSLY